MHFERLAGQWRDIRRCCQQYKNVAEVMPALKQAGWHTVA